MRYLQAGGEYDDKDEDFRRSPYNDKDTKDTEDILKCLKDIICSYLLIYLQAGGEYDDKDEDFRRSPYNDKDTKDTKDILKCLKDIICSYLLMNKKGGLVVALFFKGNSTSKCVAERKNMTLIEAARTMLADSLLPIPFWAEAVNTACYVLNRVLVTKPQNKTPYELLIGYLLGYSTTSKAFRVYNKRTKRVEENLHIDFLEDQPNVAGTGPNWMFDLDFLTNSMNYIPVSVENQVNVDAGTQYSYVVGSSESIKDLLKNTIRFQLQLKDKIPVEAVLLAHEKPSETSPKDNDKMIAQEVVAKALDDATRQAFEEEKRNIASQKRAAQTTSINKLSTEPKNISQALQDKSWVEAMQEELLHSTTEGYFLGSASYMGFTVYQMDVISAFHYGTIEEEVYVHQPPGFVDPAHPNKVYKVIKALYGLHQAPRAWYETLSSFLMENGFRREFEECVHKRFQMSSMGELTFFLGLQVKQQPNGIFISQDKYIADILKKFDFLSIRTATTPIESNKPLVKDEDGEDVDVHVTLKASRLNAVKRIFRYLKHQPKLGLWYPRDSPFVLEAFSDSDYGGASLDRKSTTGGCQFLGRRLISWQCKKQTIVANSTTEAEYVAAAKCCGQVLWIQNQMMDYGFNFMNTKSILIMRAL
ncbi:putative ribonuclease H-like domain-containing protein [Tanacetum coccineum]